MSDHDPNPATRVQAGLRRAIEAHLDQGEPAATAATMERLLQAGMRRSAALRCLGEALAAELISLAKTGQAFDEEAWARRLEAIEPSEWIAMRMRRDL